MPAGSDEEDELEEEKPKKAPAKKPASEKKAKAAKPESKQKASQLSSRFVHFFNMKICRPTWRWMTVKRILKMAAVTRSVK